MLSFIASKKQLLLTGLIAIAIMVFPFLSYPGILLSGGVVFLLTLVSWLLKLEHAIRLGLFWSFYFLTIILGSEYSQLSFIIAISGYLIFINYVQSLSSKPEWLQFGKFGKEILLLCVASAGLAAFFLILWQQLTQPDLSSLIESFIPDVGISMLIIGGLSFAMLNAVVEEIAFRGVMFEELQASMSTNTAFFVQALAFGAIHYKGFPSGWIGVGLAIIYGLMMGYIRIRAAGLLGPWVAHLLTDLVIVGILLLSI